MENTFHTYKTTSLTFAVAVWLVSVARLGFKNKAEVGYRWRYNSTTGGKDSLWVSWVMGGYNNTHTFFGFLKIIISK